MPKSSPNRPRHVTGRPHVESWFVRANHPTRPLALWLKTTILDHGSGAPEVDVWCSLFDGERSRAEGARTTMPAREARFDTAEQRVEAAGSRLALDPTDGAARGTTGPFAWDLTWSRLPGPLGEPLELLPPWLPIDAPVPKNKLLTPAPAISVRGEVRWREEAWVVDGWLGMQGHNWGASHSPEYAWGHCLFTDDGGAPFALVEAAAGRIALGRWTSPTLALMTVRRAGVEYRFDRLVDLWNRQSRSAFPAWTLRMRGPAGTALLTMRARPEEMVCLGYENPDRRVAYCLNSKLAAVSLRVNPADGDGFTCSSPHGGALEFLQQVPAPELSEVV